MRSALTSTELMLQRCPRQWSQVFVAVHRPATLFSARLASVPASWPAGSLSFNSGSPSSVSSPAGVTLYIGSSAGTRDKGMLRARSAFTTAATGTIGIAELGEQTFNLAVNDYLTVVEDFRPGAKFPRYSGGAWSMDYEVAYDPAVAIQNDNYGPLALLGPAAVGFRVGGTCKLKYVGERSAAYSPSNSINAWAWAFPSPGSPSSSASQGTTATPIAVTYNSVITGGRYHSLRVTENTTGKTHTGYRLTFIFDRTGGDAPYSAALLTGINGGPGQGGYMATLAIKNASASLTDFPDKAHVVIITEDHFADDSGEYWYTDDVTGTLTAAKTVTGATSGATGTLVAVGSGYVQIKTLTGEFIPGESISHTSPSASATIYTPNVGGNYPYRTNVLLEGWIVAETVRKNPLTGEIEFTVSTVDGLLKTIEGYPVALTNRSTTPTLSWEDYKRMTMNTATLHFVKWRSTLADIVDVNFQASGPPATAILKYVTLDKAALFEQINGFWQRSIFGWCASDLQSALYFEMDAVLDDTIRASIPTAFTMAPATDLRDNLEIPRAAHVAQNAQTVLYAVAYRKPLGSKAPDDPHFYEGVSVEVTEGVVGPLLGGDTGAPDQSTLNTWAGHLRAKANNVYRGVGHQLAGNWRFDVVPQSWFVNSYAAGDTLRGFTLASQKWLPRELRLAFNEPSYSLLADVSADAETSGLAGVAISFPKPENPPVLPPPIPGEPPIVPVPWSDAKDVWLGVMPGGGGTGGGVAWAGDYFSTPDSQPDWNLAIAPPPDATNLDWFGISRKGLNAYWIVDVNKIYQCANPKGASPAWTLIAQGGSTLGSHTVHATPVFTPAVICGDRLIFAARANTGSYDWLYGEYDGTNWLTTYVFTKNLFSLQLVALNTIADHSINWVHFIDLEFPDDLNDAWTIGFEAWHRESGSINRYFNVRKPSTGHLYLHKYPGDVDYDLGTSLNDADTRGTKIHGAENGPQVYGVVSAPGGSGHGNIVRADDGANFGILATWIPAWIADAKYGGGGNLVLAALDPGANNVPTRLYERDGTAHDKTGDYYTIFPSIAAGKIIGMGLTY